MALHGIDTASYQAGLNYSRVPMDFAIIKATQGVSYTNPDYVRSINQARKANRLIGTYHYAAGGNPEAEADFFLSIANAVIGSAILCLDWEGEQNPKFGKEDVSWCKRFCDRVYQKTGVRCFIYMSKSVCRAHDWTPVAKDYPLWCAQYASNSKTGYQPDPWTDNKGFGAWAAPTIYQYSSHGILPGWSKELDLDIAYMTPEEWAGWANGKPPEIKYPDKTDAELAVEVLWDLYGSNDTRREKLGSRYSGAQDCVDLFLEDAGELLAAIKAYGQKHGGDLFAGKDRA